MFRIGALNKRWNQGPDGARGRLRLRPGLMALEGRTLLSTFTVNSTADNGSAGTLRWAIGQANANRKADTIVFSNLFDSPQTINLSGKQLTLSDPARITITGPGENLLTVSGNNSSRVFRITSGASASLSGLTITGGSVHGNGGGVENTGGKLVLKNVVLTGNSARRGGGLFNDGATILADVATRGNTALVGSGVLSARTATLTRSGLSSLAATGAIVNQTFNGAALPSNWQQFLPGGVAESPKTFLTITDSTGQGAGIFAPANGFSALNVTTTMTAQVSSISVGPKPLGNAVFGLVGLNGTQLTGELAAGIDGQGHVFVIVYDPAQKITQQTIVAAGVFANYTGQSPVTMTFTIDSTGVQIKAATTKTTTTFPKLTFAKDLSKFSLATAFPNGAIPALVAASQQGQSGGVASFESINVSTA
jgi:hypothetical protein